MNWAPDVVPDLSAPHDHGHHSERPGKRHAEVIGTAIEGTGDYLGQGARRHLIGNEVWEAFSLDHRGWKAAPTKITVATEINFLGVGRDARHVEKNQFTGCGGDAAGA